MLTATVVYWTAGDTLVADGGGNRALAWVKALTTLGYDATVMPILSEEPDLFERREPIQSRAKRAIIPMPLMKKIPAGSTNSDLTIVTVPAVFKNALRTSGSTNLVFDWMDRWSVSSRSIGDASTMSRVGGRIQSGAWKFREKRYPSRVGVNSAAGYADYEWFRTNGSRPNVHWLPNPIDFLGRSGTRTPSASSTARLGFLGNFNYIANTLSFRYFLEHMTDALTSNNVEMVVAGFGSDMVSSWGFPVTVMGEVATVAEFYDAIDVVVVPITHGSGIKVKAIEALAHGVPVIGTDHVRHGLVPSMRRFIQPMTTLSAPLNSEQLSMPSAHEFNAVFSEEAFRATVQTMLAQLTEQQANPV
jgi:hypothetical protein